ncbi:MAG TPA: TspO/MBR family protein [Hydrogenophaga sp.]|uniref:TspO/MBR family protein n=1 Tax=Hydrogenophaga sp. TaxID=1904254 RepID=UPI002BBD44BC|nr:TspO/MBR family protein [Hydrogenophaga sp.]HSX93661.1 TspO/MBR family protein [Hydrogenophaga sp.]
MPRTLFTSPPSPWPSLAVWLLLCFAAAAIGAVASTNAPDFYAQLNRPAWAPPAWLFGPVWTVLYALIALSAWMVWREVRLEQGFAVYVLFGAQLAANALWTWLFFAWRQGQWAFVEILVLIALIVATMKVFWRIRPPAAALLVPYLAWVCFAAALTFAVWQRNPGLL